MAYKITCIYLSHIFQYSRYRTAATQTRPIAVGPPLYRSWAKLRFRHCSQQLGEVLPPYQVGGLASHDAQSLLLAFQNEASADRFGFEVSLDFSKAFDYVDWELAHMLLTRAGLPANVLGPIKNMWENQTRWFSYGGAISPNPLKNCRAILQGDPWGSLALAVLVSAPFRKLKHDLGDNLHQICFMDDRSAVMTTGDTFQQYLREWSVFEHHTRLKTNPAKTQYWARNSAAAVARLRLRLTTWLRLSRSVWNAGRCQVPWLSSERWPKQYGNHKRGLGAAAQRPSGHPRRSDQVWKCFQLGYYTTGYQGGRAAVQVRKALFLGHACNLNLVAVQALLRATSKWKRFSADRAQSWNPGQVKELKKVLVPLGVDVQPNALQQRLDIL